MSSNLVFTADKTEISEQVSFSIRRTGWDTWDASLPWETLSDCITTLTAAFSTPAGQVARGSIYQVRNIEGGHRPKSLLQWLDTDGLEPILSIFTDELVLLVAVLTDLAEFEGVAVDLDFSELTPILPNSRFDILLTEALKNTGTQFRDRVIKLAQQNSSDVTDSVVAEWFADEDSFTRQFLDEHYATKTSLSALTGRVTTAESDIDALEVADAALASRATALETLTSSGRLAEDSLDAEFVKRGELSVSVMDYGATGDGVASDSGAISAAIAAVPDGGTVKIPSGGTYRLDSQIQNNGKSVHIDAQGANFLVDFGTTVVRFEGGYETPVGVASATQGLSQPSTGGGNIYTVSLALTGPVPSEWKRGDIIRIVADDIIPGTKDEGNGNAAQGRTGQFLSFLSGTGSTAVLSGYLDDPYTTNIKVARMKSDVKCSWTGGHFDYLDSEWESEAGNTMAAIVCNAPSFRDITFKRVPRAAITFVECKDFIADHIVVMHGPNELTTSRPGYGIANNGSTGGTVSNCHFKDVRHGYTNGHAMIEAGLTDIQNHGRGQDTTIIACTAESTTASGFDSHTAGMRELYIGCHAIGCLSGFYLRGRTHQIIGCSVADAGENAVTIEQEGYAGRTWGHMIDGLSARNVAAVVSIQVNTDSSSSTPYAREARAIVARNIRASDLRARPYLVNYHTLIAENWFVERAATATGSPGGLNTGGRVFVRDWVIDLRATSATIANLFAMTNPGGSTYAETFIDGVRVFGNGTGQVTNVVGGSGTSNSLKARNVVLSNPTSGSFASVAFATASGGSELAYP